jgi:hypothetical protein
MSLTIELPLHDITAYVAPTLSDHFGHDMCFQFADYYLPDFLSVLKIMDKLACMRSQASSCAVLHGAAALHAVFCFTMKLHDDCAWPFAVLLGIKLVPAVTLC